MKKMTKATKGIVISIAVMLALLALSLILRTNSAVCEFICVNFVKAYQAVFGRLFSAVGFNVFELLAALAVAAVIACIAVSIALFCKRRRVASRRVILSMLLGVICVVNLYVFTAGFAYNRKTAPVQAYEGEIDEDLAFQAYVALIEEYNAIYESFEKYEDKTLVSPYTEKQLKEKIRAAVDETLKDRFYYSYTPKAKPIVCSEIMAQNWISGITFLPTVEPGYNKDMTLIEKCSTIAHEYAHSKGVMREDEASVVGAYALLSSGDDFLKYCAYVDIIADIGHFLPSIHSEEDEANCALNDGYIAERRKIAAYWKDKDTFAKFGEFFNDLYLKINGQKEGTGSYVEDPSSDLVDSGFVDEEGEPIYVLIIVEYTKLDRMVLGYYMSNLQGGRAA